ncbi:MAG: DNA polymerase III subunit gamma/tau [Muribaculaceae bacterium]|nr:DNA polymerase III subunit gamma/tau [Muribaculaceae bacterium]
MENYVVSARKYRPSTFASVVGQQALTATLKNAIATDRLAHAYLFCGSRGVGKTSCARIFAKTINCSHRTPDGEACNECASCREFNSNRSFNIIELDAASNNSVDDIRALTDQVMVPPTDGRYRVFIVDEVHMLSSAAFNAFLKTLEEPPAHAVFILATTEKHKIIPTILSRCQIYDFNRITVPDMVAHLSHVARNEGITAEPAALTVIARKADGAMRDALSIFDQVAASTRGNVDYRSTIENLNVLDHAYYSRLVDAFAAADVPSALLIYKEIRDKGFDSQFLLNGLAQYLRDVMVAGNPATRSLLEADDTMRDEMAATGAKLTPQFIYTALDLLNTADLNYRQAASKQLLVELTLIKLCQRFSPSTDKSSGNGGEGRLKALKPAAAPAPQAPHAAPKAPAPQQPAPQQPAPASGRPLRRVGQGPTLHPRGNARQAQPAAAAPHRTTPYTPAQVEHFWDAYRADHPKALVVCSTMETSRPRHIDADRWVMSVASVPQRDLMANAMPDILQYMREKLKNDDFALDIHVEEGEPSPEIWSRTELLEHMVEASPEFLSFIREFKLTLD